MITSEDLFHHLLTAVNDCGGINAFARRTGVSNCLVSKTLGKKIEPGDAIANALGYARPGGFIKIREVNYGR